MSPSIYSTQLLRTSATHRASLVGFVDSVWNRIGEGMAMVASSSFPNLAQSIILSALKQLKHGHLHLIIATGKSDSPSETRMTFGEGLSPAWEATLRVKRTVFWTRVLLANDMGFAEAFMYGDVECDDIPSFLRLMIMNREAFKLNHRAVGLAASLFSTPRLLTAIRFLGDITTSRANISAHYDIGNTMFTAFLSEDMNYSSAIWKDFNEDLAQHPENQLETLEDAQIRKMLNIIMRANIQKGHRVLEIGTGWGALSILAVQTTGCTIDTLTLSSEQKELAEQRIASLGLSEHIRVHLMDYREAKNVKEWEHAFDRFVSVEMMEHVGKEYMEEYWSVVEWAMKREGAVGCVQVITLPESRVEDYDADVDFIRKWVIFPGGYLPSLSLLISSMTSGSHGLLTTDHVSNIGPHYARTLREWKKRFERNYEGIIAPALKDQYGLGEEERGVFKRKWLYYFDYCEVGFATRMLGDHIISFTRENNISLGCTWNDYHQLDGQA